MSRTRQSDTNLESQIRTGFMPTSDKQDSIFYLKLQWISAKDLSEREALGKRISQLLANQVASK